MQGRLVEGEGMSRIPFRLPCAAAGRRVMRCLPTVAVVTSSGPVSSTTSTCAVNRRASDRLRAAMPPDGCRPSRAVLPRRPR